MESAPGRKGHRPDSQGVETLEKTRRSVRGGLQPGRSREGSAGRPPARGCQGQRSRPGPRGPDRFQRTRHHWARHRPGAPPPPGGRGNRTETGNGVPGSTGRSGAVGHRNGGTVGLSPDGGSCSSQVRSADRRVGSTGSERSPSGHRSQGRLPERVAGRVAVGRRNGSEELTGSPGGYSGPLSRFPASPLLFPTVRRCPSKPGRTGPPTLPTKGSARHDRGAGVQPARQAQRQSETR